MIRLCVAQRKLGKGLDPLTDSSEESDGAAGAALLSRISRSFTCVGCVGGVFCGEGKVRVYTVVRGALSMPFYTCFFDARALSRTNRRRQAFMPSFEIGDVRLVKRSFVTNIVHKSTFVEARAFPAAASAELVVWHPYEGEIAAANIIYFLTAKLCKALSSARLPARTVGGAR